MKKLLPLVFIGICASIVSFLEPEPSPVYGILDLEDVDALASSNIEISEEQLFTFADSISVVWVLPHIAEQCFNGVLPVLDSSTTVTNRIPLSYNDVYLIRHLVETSQYTHTSFLIENETMFMKLGDVKIITPVVYRN